MKNRLKSIQATPFQKTSTIKSMKHTPRTMIKSTKKFKRDRIKLSFKNYNFGLLSVSIMTLLIAVAMSLGYVSIQIYQRPKAKVISNLLKVYILGSDLWTTYVSAHLFIVQTVAYNNTVPCWGDRTTLDCYHHFREYILGEMMENVTKSAGYDLKNLTEHYSNSLLKVNKKSQLKISIKFFSFEKFYK